MAIRPGGEYAGRPLHIVWLLDCSGSMAEGGKIEALNNAIREVIPAMKKAAEGNPEVQFFIRAMRFSSGAAWHEARPTPLGEFKWVDLQAERIPTWARPSPCWPKNSSSFPRTPACSRLRWFLFPMASPLTTGAVLFRPCSVCRGASGQYARPSPLGRMPTMRPCASSSTTPSAPCFASTTPSSWSLLPLRLHLRHRTPPGREAPPPAPAPIQQPAYDDSAW